MKCYIFFEYRRSFVRVDVRNRHSSCILAAAVLLAASLLMGGCSSSSETAPDSGSSLERRIRDGLRDLSLQHYIDGLVFELRGDNARAVLEYQEALQFEKNHAIYFSLSRAYAVLGKNVAAIDAGREAVRLSPDNIEYRRNLAVIFLSSM